jgi:hypothetical protein
MAGHRAQELRLAGRDPPIPRQGPGRRCRDQRPHRRPRHVRARLALGPRNVKPVAGTPLSGCRSPRAASTPSSPSWSCSLMDDRDAGVRDMASVARSGGTVATCVWDATNMPLLRPFCDAAPRARRSDRRRPPRCLRAAELRAVFEHCGHADVETGELRVAADHAGFDELWQPLPAGVGHPVPAVRRWTPAGRRCC